MYAKRPIGDAACVLKYLARYTHRVAIANSRLLAYRDGAVTFRYKDYAQEGRQRTMTLPAAEFIRRFLLHVLPDGFMRIRSYGYLANRHRRQKLALCRRLLGVAEPAPTEAADPQAAPSTIDVELETAIRCPACRIGRLRVTETFERRPRHYDDLSRPPPDPTVIPFLDTHRDARTAAVSFDAALLRRLLGARPRYHCARSEQNAPRESQNVVRGPALRRHTSRRDSDSVSQRAVDVSIWGGRHEAIPIASSSGGSVHSSCKRVCFWAAW